NVCSELDGTAVTVRSRPPVPILNWKLDDAPTETVPVVSGSLGPRVDSTCDATDPGDSRQIVLLGLTLLAGHAVLLPAQYSSTSQAPVAARHSVSDPRNWQPMQQKVPPGTSHCSPLSGSSMPSPQVAAACSGYQSVAANSTQSVSLERIGTSLGEATGGICEPMSPQIRTVPLPRRALEEDGYSRGAGRTSASRPPGDPAHRNFLKLGTEWLVETLRNARR